MRAFTAIEIPPGIREKLLGLEQELKSRLPKVNWVAPQNLHLSLKFIGEVEPEKARILQDIFTEAAAAIQPFELKLEALGVFPGLSAARIIWIGQPDPCPQLVELADLVEKKFHSAGIPREHRPFRAHVTLGRIRQDIPRAQLEKAINELQPQVDVLQLKFRADCASFFESVLGNASPIYTRLQKADFRGRSLK